MINKSYMTMNLVFILAAVINAYLKRAGFEREVTSDDIMAVLAVVAPAANKIWHLIEVRRNRFKTRS